MRRTLCISSVVETRISELGQTVNNPGTQPKHLELANLV